MKKQSKAAVLNLDDPSFSVIEESTSVPVFTYGFQAEAQIRADRIIPSQSGIAFEVHTQALPEDRRGDGEIRRRREGETGRGGDVTNFLTEVGGTTELPSSTMEIISPLTGLHNVSNILAAIGVGLAEGIDPSKIREGIRKVSPVPGRFETIDCGQDFWVIVDFAHTADALQNLLQTARHLGPARIMIVFGCGGDRDQSKRFPMGQVAATLSDRLIITNDNSRSEDPAAIARQIEEGVYSVMQGGVLSQYEIILDRYQAIQKALSWAEPGDMVLIAGKGHEQYQVIGSQCIPFDDRQVARHILNDLTADTQAAWKPLPE